MIPLLFLWIILAPFALILFPFFIVGCLFILVNPIRAMGVGIRVFCALRGTHIEIEQPNQQFLISIR